jgi:hypothetical protein
MKIKAVIAHKMKKQECTFTHLWHQFRNGLLTEYVDPTGEEIHKYILTFIHAKVDEMPEDIKPLWMFFYKKGILKSLTKADRDLIERECNGDLEAYIDSVLYKFLVVKFVPLAEHTFKKSLL